MGLVDEGNPPRAKRSDDLPDRLRGLERRDEIAVDVEGRPSLADAAPIGREKPLPGTGEPLVDVDADVGDAGRRLRRGGHRSSTRTPRDLRERHEDRGNSRERRGVGAAGRYRLRAIPVEADDPCAGRREEDIAKPKVA